MSIIDRYIARSFLSAYIILTLVGVGMYTLIAMLLTLDEFTEDRSMSLEQVIGLIVDYYGHNLPLYYSQLGGPMMAVAAAFCVGRLLKNNELTALIAAGMPLRRLVTPFAVCGIGLALLWVVNREFVIPRFAAEIARTPDDMIGAKARGVYAIRDSRNAIMTALEFDAHRGWLGKVFIVEPDEKRAPQNLIVADEAQYDDAHKTWRLSRGVRHRLDQAARGGGAKAATDEAIQDFAFGLTPGELVLRRRSQWSELLSLNELNALVRTQNLANRPTLDMFRHTRLTQPLLQLLVLFLALPWFLTREPENVLSAGLRALIAAAALYVVTFMTQGAMGEDELTRALLAWFPIIVFAPLTFMLLANLKT